MFSFVRQAAFIGMLFFAFVSFWPALKKDHSGPARVIDAGVLEINGETHRLYGIQAVEPTQTCQPRDGSAWPCGKAAAEALAKFLEGRMVVCEPRGNDRSALYLSICYAVSDNINAWMVREGWAAADRDAPRISSFAGEESLARFLRLGVWASEPSKRE